MNKACLTVKILSGTYHGRSGSEPEWPPSPLRVIQAVCAATNARCRGTPAGYAAWPAVEWLAALPPPVIVAPTPGRPGPPRVHYVPNNAGDLVAKAWAGGDPTATSAPHRTAKVARPRPVAGEIHYLWDLPDDAAEGLAREYAPEVDRSARLVTHLGWGVDSACARFAVVAGDVRVPGERWLPGSGRNFLRVPAFGTLAAMRDRARAYRVRVDGSHFTPVAPLSVYDRVAYARDVEHAPRPYAAFALLDPGGGFLPVAATRCGETARAVRKAVAGAAWASGWPEDRVAAFVLGHDPETAGRLTGPGADRRFSYLVLPTVTPYGAGAVRRVLVAAPPGDAESAAWLARVGPGLALPDAGGAGAVLSPLPPGDAVLAKYARPSAVWASVTPVLGAGLAGDRARVARNLRLALGHAGLPPGLVESAEIDWRVPAFVPGVPPARDFRQPGEYTRPAVHVRIRWPLPVAGPIAVGAGRYLGFGVLVGTGAG